MIAAPHVERHVGVESAVPCLVVGILVAQGRGVALLFANEKTRLEMRGAIEDITDSST